MLPFRINLDFLISEKSNTFFYSGSKYLLRKSGKYRSRFRQSAWLETGTDRFSRTAVYHRD
uniref:Uncharacterized protein n=1 Tax=uncultured Desulfobacterium sp. TaxID=201089 RepID=E1YCQ0_9BACT|nr:unknown protein [uncultured Desulfobacterium sp.]